MTSTQEQLDLAGLQKAQGEARLAIAAAQKAELELGKIKSPSPPGVYAELEKLKGLLPSGAPTASAPSALSEQVTFLPAFVYEALPDAVQAVANGIKDTEQFKRSPKDTVMYWMDDDLILNARAYLNLLAKAHALARLYSELLKPTPFSLQDFGITSVLLGVYGLQALSAGVASAQGIAQAFFPRTSTRADSVDVDPQVFQDLLRTELVGAVSQVSNSVWDLENAQLNTLTEDKSSPLGQALKALVELLNSTPTGDQKEAREELRKAVTALVESMMLTGQAALRHVEQVSREIHPPSPQNLNGSKKKLEVLFITARALKAGAVAIVREQSLIRARKISVDAFIVTTFTVTRPDGTVVASNLLVTRRSSVYEAHV